MKIHTTAHLLIVAAEFPIYPCRFLGQFTALGSSLRNEAVIPQKRSKFLFRWDPPGEASRHIRASGYQANQLPQKLRLRLPNFTGSTSCGYFSQKPAGSSGFRLAGVELLTTQAGVQLLRSTIAVSRRKFRPQRPIQGSQQTRSSRCCKDARPEPRLWRH